jgi:hypothetical protein
MSGSDRSATVVAQIVEAMRALAGSHPGFRPVHGKGIVCSGTFRGAPEARDVSRAVHLKGHAVPTIVRFADASGNPEVHDSLASTRSLAVKFRYPMARTPTSWRTRSRGSRCGRLRTFSRSCGRRRLSTKIVRNVIDGSLRAMMRDASKSGFEVSFPFGDSNGRGVLFRVPIHSPRRSATGCLNISAPSAGV